MGHDASCRQLRNFVLKPKLRLKEGQCSDSNKIMRSKKTDDE